MISQVIVDQPLGHLKKTQKNICDITSDWWSTLRPFEKNTKKNVCDITSDCWSTLRPFKKNTKKCLWHHKWLTAVTWSDQIDLRSIKPYNDVATRRGGCHLSQALQKKQKKTFVTSQVIDDQLLGHLKKTQKNICDITSDCWSTLRPFKKNTKKHLWHHKWLMINP